MKELVLKLESEICSYKDENCFFVSKIDDFFVKFSNVDVDLSYVVFFSYEDLENLKNLCERMIFMIS